MTNGSHCGQSRQLDPPFYIPEHSHQDLADSAGFVTALNFLVVISSEEPTRPFSIPKLKWLDQISLPATLLQYPKVTGLQSSFLHQFETHSLTKIQYLNLQPCTETGLSPGIPNLYKHSFPSLSLLLVVEVARLQISCIQVNHCYHFSSQNLSRQHLKSRCPWIYQTHLSNSEELPKVLLVNHRSRNGKAVRLLFLQLQP